MRTGAQWPPTPLSGSCGRRLGPYLEVPVHTAALSGATEVTAGQTAIMLRNGGEKTDRSWYLGKLGSGRACGPGRSAPGTELGLAGMGSLVSLPAVPRASSAGARIVTWPTPAPVSRTVPSTARAGTDASTAACRNAWHWACPETVRPAGRQPPELPLLGCTNALPL